MKTKIFVLCVMAMVIAVIASSGPVQQSANQLYQSGIYKEDVEGKLEEAIATYQEIIKKFPKEGPVAAKAWFHIGLCYEKLGNQEAQKAYQQVLSNYADQKDIASQARARLTALATKATEPRFTNIRVPTGLPGNARYALSPDGQQLAYIEKGSVWLVPVHGATDPSIAGAPRQITQQNKSWTETTDITWSGDGRWLALHVKESGSDKLEYAVYMVNSAGGEPRKVPLELKSRERVFHDSRLSLSPNGKWMAYTTWPDGGSPADRSIYLAPTDGGSARRLTQPITSDPAFSPDGKRIAYLGLAGSPDWQTGGERGRQLWIASVDGGSPVLVYELSGPGRIAGPTWSPDGRSLAILANHDNRTDDCKEMLLIPIGLDGRASGPPARLTMPYGVNQWPAGWSSGDQIGLILNKPLEAAIYTVPASGGKAVQLTPDWAMTPGWTPDGKRICYQGDHFDAIAKIECIPSQGGKMEMIPFRGHGPNPLELSYPGIGISVSPDGKRILFMGSYRGTARRMTQIFTIPIEGGDVAELTNDMPATNPCWSPDGKSIAYIHWETTDVKYKFLHDIYLKPVEGGKASKLTSQSDQVAYAAIAWSPDGSGIAFHSDGGRKIKLIPVGGGPARILIDGCTGGPGRLLAWSPDGKQLLYSTENRIWKLDLATGKSEELQTGLKLIQTEMAWAPDGKTIALGGMKEAETELWLVEDFLSTHRTAESPEAKQAAREQTKPAPKFRQIEIPGKPPIRSAAMLSPDGTRFAFLAEGDIWTVPVSGGVHPNIAGEPVRLTKNMGGWEAGNCTVTWSTDGQWIAFRAKPNDSVYLVPASGGEPRRVDGIGPAPGGAQLMRISVSQSAKRIVFAAGESLHPSLFTIPGEGGHPTQLVPEITVYPAFSPNNKLVAYFKAKGTDSGRFPSIMAVAADGGEPVLVSSLPRNASTDSPVWSPDGKMIAFPVLAEESYELWIVPVSSDGRPVAEPTKFDLKPIAEAKLRGKSVFKFMDPLGGWSRKNEIALLLEKPEDSAIYRVPASGGRATLIGLDGRTPRWSPDGKRVYFRGRTNIESVAADGGDEKPVAIRYKTPLNVWFPTGSNEISKDGRDIVFAGGARRNEQGQSEAGIYTVPSQGGEARPITIPASGYALNPSWSPDGKWIAYCITGPEPDERRSIWISPSEGGEPKQLTSDADRVGEGEVRWSPDGKMIAYFGADKTLRLIPSAGGLSRVLTQVPAEDIALRFYGLSWSPDGSRLVYTTFQKVWIIPASGGKPQEVPVGFDGSRIMQIDWSPDGKTLAFTGVSGAEEEVWLMSDFLHLVKTPR